MKTEHICLDCDASKAMADNSTPDQVSKRHACWFEKYDINHDKDGKYCIYWDDEKRITQFGFEEYESDVNVTVHERYKSKYLD